MFDQVKVGAVKKVRPNPDPNTLALALALTLALTSTRTRTLALTLTLTLDQVLRMMATAALTLTPPVTLTRNVGARYDGPCDQRDGQAGLLQH